MPGYGIPTENPRRRNRRPSGVILPRRGRRGRPPAWPLVDQSDRERELWAKLWKLPQAVAWSGCGLELPIARYCRVAARAEQPRASAALLSEVRQLEGLFGLTPVSLLRLRWRIEDPADVVPLPPGDIRNRLRAVE